MESRMFKNRTTYALLYELKRLNDYIVESNMKYAFSKQSGVFLYGFNSQGMVSPEIYKRYTAFINAISAVLSEFGISMNNNGYSYIVDAVMLIIDQNRLDIKLRNDIYPYIKEKYSLNSSAAVEHSIRNAIRASFNKSKVNTEICRMNYYEKKPTNKEFLFIVTQDVCSRMCNEMMG